MNCTQAAEQLAVLVYGDLEPARAAEVQEHLRGCPACRAERRALEEVRRLLGRDGTPPVRIDLARLYRDSAARQTLKLGRWRRAVAVCGAAAAVAAVCLAGLRLQVRLDRDQLVLSWGTPARSASQSAEARSQASADKTARPDSLESAGARAAAPESKTPRTVEEQLLLLTRLVHAVADDVQSLEHRQNESAAHFRTRLEGVQEQTLRRCAALEHQVDALYVLSQKGE
jgi:Putative zinc-finger